MKKNTLKLLAALFVSVLLLAGNSYSQDKQKNINPEERAQKLTEKLNKTVDLTVEQQSKIQQLYQSHFAKMQTLRESAKDKEKSEVRQNIREQRTELRKGIKEILTKEQTDKLKKSMKHRRCKCGHHKRHH